MSGLKNFLGKALLFTQPSEHEAFVIEEDYCEKRLMPEGMNEDKSKDRNKENDIISKKLSENLEYIKGKYTIPLSGDLIIREFDIVVKSKTISAFMIFFDGMVDRKVINDDILQPLMLLSNMDIKGDNQDIGEFVKSHLLPHTQVKVVDEHHLIIEEVNFGGCGLYIDGISSAFAADVKGWEHRGVDKPITEVIIRGPQEGFNESLRANTALIRKRLLDENVIAESLRLGKRSKTPCSIMYIKDIANVSLVNEVRRRLESLEIDYISDTGELEQFIEDSPYLPLPQIIATERPDRVSNFLTEGRVAVVMHGSPFVLVMPATNTDFTSSPEDSYIRFPYAILLRAIRVLAVIVSLLLPAIYLAVTNFHQEMIPTDLLFAIEASREKVPFPSILEILIMEVSFELIREAGVRIPGPIGPTLGIIGALILGQAAVAANIVSPVLIIIVAVTGIGSFAIPSFSMALGYRVLRFGYIFLGASAGLFGITAGLFIQGIIMVSTKSFGVPYLAPFAPKTSENLFAQVFRNPIWQEETRPDYLNPQKIKKQNNISRGWTK